MSRTLLLAMGLIVSAVSSAPAQGLPFLPRTFVAPVTYYYGAGNYGRYSSSYGYYGPQWGYHHASTEAEGRLRGMADLLRARGDYELRAAAAAVLRETASQAQIDTERKAYEAKEARRAEYRRRQTQLAAEKKAERAAAAARVVPVVTLSDSDFDRDSGTLSWPVVLMRPEFAADRAKIDRLCQSWSGQEEWNASTGAAIKVAAHKLRNRLGEVAAEVSGPDYREASRFLAGLVTEGARLQ